MRHIDNIAKRLTRLRVTRFHALALADAYLAAAPRVPKTTALRFYACTFVWISSKFLENAILVDDLGEFAHGTGDLLKQRLVALEARVLQRVQWQLNVCDACTVVELLVEDRNVQPAVVDQATAAILERYINHTETHLDVRTVARTCLDNALKAA